MIPTRVLAVGVSVVALGALLLVANEPDDAADSAQRGTTVSAPTAAASPDASARDAAAEAKPAPLKPKPEPIQRGQVFVEVFNNSSIKGLAGATASKVKLAGWNVVATDNWYGTIETTTVYYPDRLKRAAELLARDLGIKQTRPAISPMRLDRLTLILTSDYS